MKKNAKQPKSALGLSYDANSLYDHQENPNNHQANSNGEIKKMGWKKIVLFLVGFVSIFALVACLWIFLFRGKDYLDYKKLAINTYESALVSTDAQAVEKLPFNNELLKKSTLNMIVELKQIYNDGGFRQLDDQGDVLVQNYKYSKNRFYDDDFFNVNETKIEVLNLTSKNDYLFGFVDNSLNNKVKPTPEQPYYHRFFSERVAIRIKDGQVVGVGFDGTISTISNRYTWINGSLTSDLGGK